jgi:hypothetical protein
VAKVSRKMLILLVGNLSLKEIQLTQFHSELSKLGSVDFEQQDRISMVSLKKKYDLIQSFSLDNIDLLYKALNSAGKLQVFQTCFRESGLAIENNNVFTTANNLNSQFIMNGFINIKTKVIGFNDEEIKELGELAIKVEKIEIVGEKPSYKSGGGLLRKKKTAVVAEPVKVAPVVIEPKVWTISADDNDEDEFEDEDDLLDEEDLVIPETAPSGDCSTKKKACKDCSCGRAEEEALEEQNLVSKITVVTAKKVTSSCGSCFLGDAFRCSSCPYLGMPAFKPGEKVVLGGNMLKDDIEL